MTTRYFTSTAYHPSALLRRTKDADEAFVGGAWRSTPSIVDSLAGNDDFVDEITEVQAKAFAPAAFTGGHQEKTMTTRYFTSEKYEPTALLRRAEFVDEAFVNGAWRPTKSIVDWMFGHDDFVDQITEEQARAFAPAAFTGGHQEKAMTMTTYYKQTRYATDVVGRKNGGREDAWNASAGKWVPTRWITDWMYGHDDFVDQISEEQARAFAPAAFTGQPRIWV